MGYGKTTGREDYGKTTGRLREDYGKDWVKVADGEFRACFIGLR